MYKFAADYRLNEDGRVHFLVTGSRFPLKFRTCLVGVRALGVNLEKRNCSYYRKRLYIFSLLIKLVEV